MDARTFDQLTRVLARATSRRQAIKRLAAASIGIIGGTKGLQLASASHCGGLGTCGFPHEDATCCDGNIETCCTFPSSVCPEAFACCPNDYQCAGTIGAGVQCIPPGGEGA